jgi:hypothetical protein
VIAHIVCFRLRPGITWADPRAVAAEAVSHRHPEHIPEILSWSAGRNSTFRDVAYDFAVIGRFADRPALERYISHPHHLIGVRAWRELANWVVVDLDESENALLAAL